MITIALVVGALSVAFATLFTYAFNIAAAGIVTCFIALIDAVLSRRN